MLKKILSIKAKDVIKTILVSIQTLLLIVILAAICKIFYAKSIFVVAKMSASIVFSLILSYFLIKDV